MLYSQCVDWIGIANTRHLKDLMEMVVGREADGSKKRIDKDAREDQQKKALFISLRDNQLIFY